MTLLLLLACTLSRRDLDGDGYAAPEDCDDLDHTAHPGGVEIPNDGIDQDCRDGDLDDVDEDGRVTGVDCDDNDPAVGAPPDYFRDADGDGYGDPARPAPDCGLDGYVRDAADCDDGDDEIWPRDGADQPATVPGDHAERCDDGVDQNCNGSADGCDLVGSFLANAASTIVDGGSYGPRTGRDGDCGAGLWMGYHVAYVPDLGGPGVPGLATTGSYPDCADTLLVWSESWRDAGTLQTASFLDPYRDVTDDDTPTQPLAGSSVAPGPDADGDGARDVLMGGLNAEDHAGRVWLVRGGVSGTLGDREVLATWTGGSDAVVDEELGSAVVAYDWDGDGTDEIAIAAQSATTAAGGWAGRVYVFEGPFAGEVDLADAAATFDGVEEGGALGVAMVAIEDLGGDGRSALVIGASNVEGQDSGAAYVVTGARTGTVRVGDEVVIAGERGDTTYFGAALADGGSFFGDEEGKALVVGAWARDSDGHENAGAVYVFRGRELPASASDAPVRVFGEGNDNAYGFAVAGGGDVNADGFDDVVGGAFRAARDADSCAGRAGLVLGPGRETDVLGSSDGRFAGSSAFDQLGRSVALGDLDGDGRADLVLAADNQQTITTSYPGMLYVFFGGTL